MGFFKKKEKKEEEIPRLPELPKLPEFPEIKGDSIEKITPLPSFPNGSLGNKFSQDTIKEAVTGKKEEEVEADEFAEESIQMMRKPLIKENIEREIYPRIERKTKETEPLFVRIDKFEEASRIFEETKRQISEIEKMFLDIKTIKEKEEKELEFWEGEIKQVKEKIENINNNIFSKGE